jgi:23S rRNA (cytosine1962-C5)-methyltransferase
MKEIVLNPEREFSVSRRHPWIFSGAVAAVKGDPEPGATVRVVSAAGEVMGFGSYSPESQIRVRMWTFSEDADVNRALVRDRVARAIGARAVLFAEARTDALRLINAEADGMPGVTVDKYGDWLVCQFTTAGAEYWKSVIVEALQTYMPCRGIYERSEAGARKLEGLAETVGLLAGEMPPELIEITEHGCRYLVDVREGQKTGFYLDQRDNRRIAALYANGCEVLNAFSYTGGFGIAALNASARSVTHVDISEPALTMARENTLLNTCDLDCSEFIHGNVFEVLRKFRDQGRLFDMVILDPPKFAESKSSLMKAARGYKDINLLGLKLLRPGGILATFSCSGLMAPELFQKVVADAAVDAQRDVQLAMRLQQAADHPHGLCFPEGLYLKGLLCRVW